MAFLQGFFRIDFTSVLAVGNACHGGTEDIQTAYLVVSPVAPARRAPLTGMADR
jgi:hypothetical protein